MTYMVLQTDELKKWLMKLRDGHARARILLRVKRMEEGNPGDVSPVGQGISEARIDYGPGYRLYFKQTDKTIIILLFGGDKSTQKDDIRRAHELGKKV